VRVGEQDIGVSPGRFSEPGPQYADGLLSQWRAAFLASLALAANLRPAAPESRLKQKKDAS